MFDWKEKSVLFHFHAVVGSGLFGNLPFLILSCWILGASVESDKNLELGFHVLYQNLTFSL